MQQGELKSQCQRTVHQTTLAPAGGYWMDNKWKQDRGYRIKDTSDSSGKYVRKKDHQKSIGSL